MIFWRASIFSTVLAIGISGCRDDRAKPVDSAAAVVPTPPPAMVMATTGWDQEAAGRVMMLSVPDNGAATFVVLPEATDSSWSETNPPLDSINGMDVELFSRSGLSGSTSLIIDSRSPGVDGCIAWPRGRLAEVPPESWRVGFAKGLVSPIPFDSIDVMSARDSARLAGEVIRLASILAEGDDPAFRGLPFSIRRAYRLSLPNGSVIVGNVIRRINEEANPRAEHLLLVAERASAASGAYTPVFHTRVAGSEEAVRTAEILAGVRFVRSGKPALVVSFEYENGSRTALLQQVSEREWKISWRSAYTGC